VAPGQRPLLVSDARGIIFIANQPGWRYRNLRPLMTTTAELKATRQYDKQPLTPLDAQRCAVSTTTATWRGSKARTATPLPLGVPAADRRRLDPAPAAQTPVAFEDSATPASPLPVVAGAGVSLLFLNQRWRLAKMRQRSREELEQLVEERTRAAHRPGRPGAIGQTGGAGQMSAALAHEINQPLTAQRMQLATLRLLLDHGRVDDAYKALKPLDDMLTRMAALTGHLKTFARKSPSGLRERLDLATVVDQSLHLLDARLRDEAIGVVLHLTRPAWVRGDAIRLEQVLINLLRNALDAMQDKPRKRLEIRLEADEQLWRLSVIDNGGGIAEEHLAKVFDPFFTTKPVGDGLGLGLAVSYAIVHESGGRLTAGNRATAVFTLTLPIDLETPWLMLNSVMVVDDEASIRTPSNNG
jgi:two-component system C4-dicarboxylate transport sensor histidine kinase DctB